MKSIATPRALRDLRTEDAFEQGPAPAPLTRSLLDTDTFSEVMKRRNANVVQAARA